MFQSAGLFKDVSCAYFLYGLCERPHCHFKHSKQEENKARKEVEEIKKDNDEQYVVPTSSLQQTLQAIEDNIKSEKQRLCSKDSKEEDQNRTQLKKSVKNKPTGTPEYNPTPIQELKNQRIKGKLGRSKYDLALLQKPQNDTEYDPECNFSTNTHVDKAEESLPAYATSLQNVSALKRAADDDEEEEKSPLAKIPKFVTVDYTPSVIEADGSDEEPFGEKEDWFSENESVKSNESETVASTENNQDKEASVNESRKKLKENDSLPIEFTSDGFVKYTPAQVDTKKKNSEASDKTKTSPEKKAHSDKSEKTKVKENHVNPVKDKSNDNIFNLFKDEFDKAFESIESSKESSGRKDTKDSISHKINSDSDSKAKTVDRRSKETKPKKHCDNNHKHHSKDKCSSDSSKSGHKDNSDHKRSSKDKGVTSKPSSSSSKPSSSSSRHSSSKSPNSSSKDSKPSSSSKHDLDSSKDRKPSSASRHDADNKDTHSKKHKDKDSKKNKKSSKHHRDSSGHRVKKKSIVNLDVDLFGEDVLNLSNNHHDDDLSDLEKYFEDEDPFEECLRIFNEDTGNTDTAKVPEKKKLKKTSTNDEAPPPVIGKKRIALKESEEKVKRQKIEDKPKPKPSPAQVMMNRYKMMQERALQEEQERKEIIKAKVREMQADKRANPPPQKSGSSIPGAIATFTTYMNDKNKKTKAITAAKGVKRKAHTPTVAIAKLKRPVVEVTSSSKVPANVRQRYLNLFIDECLKLCSSEQEAFDKGKEEEEAVFSRCSNKKIYLNIAVNTIKRLRREIEEKNTRSSKANSHKSSKLSHAAMLDGAHATKSTFTVNRSGGAIKLREEDFVGADLYRRLETYILSEEQLNLNNFPRQDPSKGGCAIFMGQQDTSQKGSVKGYEKICVRCGKRFEVYPNGKYPKKEECVYHWGKAWKKKIAGAIDTRYTCCSGDLSAEGCQVAKAHVHETNKKENLSGFMKTIPCSPPLDGDYGVYALDCEMVYTTMGMELARVTVVGGDCEIVYESLVQPDNPVVDCNTRFSGIQEDDLEDVHTTPRDVQAVLLSLFTDKTILIGHSLESDLIALKLIHSTVVDTSIVFPHRMGLPYKRALKNLMAEYLQKIIQDDVAGHDSHEDAVACIQLMQYKLKEDARKEGRRLSN